MAISALNFTSERLRQMFTADDKFFKKMLMFFELKVPAEVGLFGTSYLFPLIVPPQSYTLEEPFTLESTPTQGGGLYIEENGIVQRMIRISGTTGFKPRRLPLTANGPQALFAVSPEKRSHGRMLSSFVLLAISGQKHLQYLQDAVFRTYADLKRDPNTAEDTKLIFHIPKDDEHWLVAPQKFTIERSSAKATLYNYSIDLLVIDSAEAVDQNFSEDSWLDAVKNVIHDIKKAIDLAQGAINDLTKIVGEIKGYVKNIAAIIDGVSGVIDAAKNFVSGVTELLESPLTVINSMAGVIESALSAYDTLEQSRDDIQKLPETVKQKFRDMEDAMDRISSHPEVTSPSTDTQNKKANKKTDPSGQIPLSERASATTPTTLAEVRKLGTKATAGDVQSADGKSNVPKRQSPTYRSGKRLSISKGDTLANLAATYLGDARKWQDLAVVNGLKPPFVNEQASLDLTKADESVLPGALGVSDKIIIPSTSKGPMQLPLLPVLGVKPWETLDVQLLGRDIALRLLSAESRLGKPLYDIPIDVEGGGIDVKLVGGLDNLSQGLTNRLHTEKGTDTLYKRMGLERVVGLNIAPLDLETLRFRISQAIRQDGRIASVRKIVFPGLDTDEELDSSIPLDAVVSDITAEVRGFTDSANVRLVL
jgi:hypothetical protein